MKDAWRGIAAAGLASALSYGFWLNWDEGGPEWGAGLFFGFLVLAPSVRGTLRRLGLVISSIATYRGAVWVAEELYTDAWWPDVAAFALAGAGGAAALTLAASFVLTVQPQTRSFLFGVLTGALAGPFFSLAFRSPDESLSGHVTLLLGFAVWQVGYTLAHKLRPWAPSSTYE